MTRREFIIVLASAAATFPFVARAQRPERTRRIGVLMLYPENDPQGPRRGIPARAREGGLDSRRKSSDQLSLGHGRRRLGTTAATQALRQAPDVMLANAISATSP